MQALRSALNRSLALMASAPLLLPKLCLAQGFSKVTVSLPEAALAAADLDYIDKYVTKFLQIRTASAATQLPAAATPADARQARMFMFGAFMLTKCR